ncbi:MAG: DnaA N-terminal domain-containing protein [Anaerolineae bacterium]
MPNQLDRQNGDQQVEVEVVDLDPTLRGYHVAWNYGTRYWLPLLGPLPWAVWQTLLSFCFGGRDTCWPSIELLADIAAKGNRHLILGRWRGKGTDRRRQPGALEILQEAGLLAIETQHSGSQTRYRFRLLKQPPLLAPDQLAKLSLRLQESHAELLARCGLDERTYQQLIHTLRGRGVQGTTLAAQATTPDGHDSTPAGQDSTNKYKEELQIEELWRTIKEALKLEMTESNYGTYIADTQAISFDRDTGTLVLEAPSPLVANQLNSYFAIVVRRVVATTNATIQGIPIAAVEFIPRA